MKRNEELKTIEAVREREREREQQTKENKRKDMK